MQTISNLLKHRAVVAGLGILIGIVIILGVRYATYSPQAVHYHANFAVYINGERELFKSPEYYEEISACSTKNGITAPEQRAHMHDEDNATVHVHDHAVTWGQFFANIGWYVGPNFIESRDGTLYSNTPDKKVHFMLDGRLLSDHSSIANTIIKDKDHLLVSFGSEDEAALTTQYQTIPSTAEHYDMGKDPMSCSSGEMATPADRLQHLF